MTPELDKALNILLLEVDETVNVYDLRKLVERSEKEQAVEFSGWMWENHYDFWQFNGKEMDELYNQFKAEQL